MVAALLKDVQRQRMQWIMEDGMVTDAYEASLTEIPATKGTTFD
jgi:hypothetical protein